MKKNRRFRTILFTLLGLITLIISADIVLSKLAVRKLKSGLASAGITAGSVHADLVTRSITLHDFRWQVESTDSISYDGGMVPSTSLALDFSAETIQASWISIISFIRNHQLHLGSLKVLRGKIVADRQKLEQMQATVDQHKEFDADKPLPFRQLNIGSIALENFDITIRYDSITEHKANVSLILDEVILNDMKRLKEVDAWSVANVKANLRGYQMSAKPYLYTMNVEEVDLDTRSKTMTAQGIGLLPRYGKYKFSRRLGKQIDRFVLRVPKLEIAGLDMSQIRDSIITASSLRITNANLHVFRDKRLPFIKHHNTPLPMALIRKMAFGFALDSLSLVDARITYEEFPEKGFRTGYIVFDRLNAQITSLTNRDFYPGLKKSVLQVTSRVMQNGGIKVDFTIPYDKAQVYNATGRIYNLRLASLNPILESLAFVKIESGRLNSLDFNFDYDEYTSRGNILVNYENLKMAGLTKDKESKENNVKSLALNVFVRKDKDREVPIQKRSGKVFYERDRRRAVFNVWVKSLFSGVKSSVVDPPAERKPQTRKEKRDSLRQFRKDNRERKKKERQEERNEKRNEASDTVTVISSQQ